MKFRMMRENTQMLPDDERLGAPVGCWLPPPPPGPDALQGRYARLERLDPDRHAAALFAANTVDDTMWDYLPYGPFATLAEYRRWVQEMSVSADPLFYAIRDEDTAAWGGVASYLRINPEMGSIEIGHIALSRGLRRQRAATEALFLMMQWAFDAGYRRFEWKCNALNGASRRAAERLGLSYEGVFRQAAVIKGRNRDTAWFAAIDAEWPALSRAFAAWLAPENFASGARQKTRLSALTGPLLNGRDPIHADP